MFSARLKCVLASASALAYVDRQTLPVVIGEIQKTIPISDQQYGNLQFLFLLAYGVMYAVAGKLTDAIGARWGYFAIVVWWSAANVMQGTISSVLGLGAGLFLLGLGEGGCFRRWQGHLRVVFREGAFACLRHLQRRIGLWCHHRTALDRPIVLRLNWRWVFFITGSAGFVWALAWLGLYYPPACHKRLTGQERTYIAEGQPVANTSSNAAAKRMPWVELFRFRQIWGLLIARFFSDAAWFFLIFWLPKYLFDIRHLNIKTIGYYAWIPYAMASLGSLLGGWLSSYLIRRKLSLDASRKICLGLSAACLPLSLLITVSPLAVSIVFFSFAMLGHQSWSTLLQTLTADMFPSEIVGSVAGLLGAAGAFGGMLSNLIAGTLLTHYHSYGLVLGISGLMHPLSFVILLLVVQTIRLILKPTLNLAAKPAH